MFENLGFKLRSLRTECHLSRKQVADRVGVTSAMIGFYETGDRLPSITILVKLATIYHVSVDYLLDIKNQNKEILSLDGLTENQIKSLQYVADCYRKLK